MLSERLVWTSTEWCAGLVRELEVLESVGLSGAVQKSLSSKSESQLVIIWEEISFFICMDICQNSHVSVMNCSSKNASCNLFWRSCLNEIQVYKSYIVV